MKLKRLGTPLHLSANKHLIFRIDNPNQNVIGLPVLDASMEAPKGTVLDLFGPVEKPFLSVALTGDKDTELNNLSQSTFFISLKEKVSRKRYSKRITNK
ncbi:MAG: H/ACA ribonucleoprotein complex subunit GAR1 [Candidatus Hodarchaeota archaeon]